MELTEEQEEFVSGDYGKVILDAPAGSGKTEVVAARVARSVEEGRKVRVSCFTHAAQRVIRARLDAAGLSSVPVQTVGSLAYEVVSDVVGSGFLNVGDGSEVAREVVARSGFKAGDLLALESAVANGAPVSWRLGDVPVELYERYQERKAELGYYTYTDLFGLAGVLPLSDDADEVIVDEAQDLTPAQLRMMLRLDAGTLVLAGDSGQAIYGFSGVNPEMFAQLEASGDWQRVSLSQSFRVPAAMLPVANAARDVPMSSVRAGGTVRVLVGQDRSELVRRVVSEVCEGDVVLGLTRRSLSRVSSELELSRGLGASCSWDGVLDPGTVGFSTIHSGKGGEWRRVFVLDVCASGLRSSHPMTEAEVARLFYVAATRASEELVLCSLDGCLPYGVVLDD